MKPFDVDPQVPDHAASAVTECFSRYARTGDPAALWPGLAEQARVAAAREIERVTFRVLAGSHGVPIDPLNRHDPYAVSIAAFTTGMGPLLGRWTEDGIITGRPSIEARLRLHLDHGRARAARIERELMPALDALSYRHITPAVLKGFHTGRTYFEEPGVRPMADVDLLVPPDRFDDAEDALRAIGYSAASGIAKPLKRDWIGPGIDPRVFSLELTHSQSRWVVEVHSSLDRYFHAGAVATLDRAGYCLEPWEIAGRSLLVPAQPLLLVLLACHASQHLDGLRLLRLVEIVRVIRADTASGKLDWTVALAFLDATGAARFAYPALTLAESLAPGTVDPRVLAKGRRESTWAARHTVERLTPAGGSLDQRGMLSHLMWSRGPLQVTRRLLGVLWVGSIRGWLLRLHRVLRRSFQLSAPNEVDAG